MGKNERDTSRDYAILTTLIPEEIRKKYINLKFVLYGEPFKDSRPRVTKFGGVAMINMLKMKKVFSQLYDKTPLLQNLTIQSPYVVRLNMYSKPTKNVLKEINKDKSTLKEYNNETLRDMAIADIDNSIKIHNDILFEPEYRITLDDAMNIAVIGDKFLSDNPRAELYVYFSVKTSKFYRWRLENNHNYFKWLISFKNMSMNKRTYIDQRKHLFKILREPLVGIKNNNDATKYVRRVVRELETYPADVLKEISNTKSEKNFTKNNAILALLLECFKNHALCLDKLHNIDFVEEEQHDDYEQGNFMGIYQDFFEK